MISLQYRRKEKNVSSQAAQKAATEIVATAANGWFMFGVNILVFAAGILVLTRIGEGTGTTLPGVLGGVLLFLGVLVMCGYFTLQPNQARVLILFGAYKGTVRESGFYWANPLYSRSRGNAAPQDAGSGEKSQKGKLAMGTQPGMRMSFLTTKISLRAHNFSSDTLKVNDKRGNPIEIATVVVWRVEDTAQAVFDVENYTSYVEIQSESALRTVASRYAYDQGEDHEITLRGGADDVAHALKQELQERLNKAGVIVEDARLTHLAYAPEIASAMLRRQQAEAVIAARRIIVQNAVIMVHTALEELDRNNVVKLDDERRAAMVSNLLVVLCGSSEASPVINTGTLYT
jgi:regulator of protease activity HflC (stomatin/prohibitin superfamily)